MGQNHKNDIIRLLAYNRNHCNISSLLKSSLY